MKEVKKIKDAKFLAEVDDMMRIANEAVFKAKQENKRLGIPEYFMKGGQLYFVLPSGEITMKVPEIMKGNKPLE